MLRSTFKKSKMKIKKLKHRSRNTQKPPNFINHGISKGRSKPVQYFIQHHVFAMLDEMLEWFAPLQNL